MASQRSTSLNFKLLYKLSIIQQNVVHNTVCVIQNSSPDSSVYAIFFNEISMIFPKVLHFKLIKHQQTPMKRTVLE